MREDGKDTMTNSRKPEPRVVVRWDRLAIIVVALAVAGLLGYLAVLYLVRVVYPW
jgi:hypothetical protein